MTEPDRRCRQCGADLPPRKPGPGRPRVYCSRECSRTWHYARESERLEAERRVNWETARYEADRRIYGKREADRRRRERNR